MNDKIWKVYDPNPRLRDTLCSEMGVSPLFAQILLNRGIITPVQAQSFLFGGLSSCHDPFLMKDMDKAVARIKKAAQKKEKVLIHGDYDVDGVTSTALLSSVLTCMDIEHETFIPNRLEEGYGFNAGAVSLARGKGIGLIITVDCGINSFDEVSSAKDHGIDVIITDHHEIRSEELPPALAVIDVHREDCAYPFKGLAGVGVAYKLAKALMGLRGDDVDCHLDLVALGTVADIVSLNGENRILVKEGLKRLKDTDKCGLKALMEISRIKQESLTSRHISFALGPRINAMGRVGSANVALDLLMCRDPENARIIAGVLEKENRNRQAIEKDLLGEVMKAAVKEIQAGGRSVMVLAGESWHQGVLGIVASKITEEYDLPAVLIGFEGENGKGSGRSVDGFNLFEALEEVGSYLSDFGGHEAACGVRIRRDAMDDFRNALNRVAGRRLAARKKKAPELKIDLNLPFSHIEMRLVRELEMLMPYGPDNLEPVFSTNSIRVKSSPRQLRGGGFKFLASCGNLTCEAITFRRNKVAKPARGSTINLAYTPSVNDWEGIETIQLNIKDLQVVM